MRNFTKCVLPRLVACWMVWLGFGWGVAFGQTPEWRWQNPLPTGNHLEDVFFLDSQTGWAVGGFGTILKTINGGQSWQLQSSGTSNALVSVHFTNAQTGWVVGGAAGVSTILKTTNGGTTWQAQTFSPAINPLHSVYFINAQTGWAVGDNATIVKTTNGGGTWQEQGGGYHLHSVHFINAQTGWAVGQLGAMMKTTNGGSTWQAQTSGTVNEFRSVRFINAQTGWAIGQNGMILKTTNGGTNWQAQTSGTTRWLWASHFIDGQTGWVVGDYGTLLKTSDGGSTWQAQTSGTTKSLGSTYFTDAQTGWMVGNYGTLLKTSDGGSTWQSQTYGPKNNLRSLHFTNAQTGWAVGDSGHIIKTINGGLNWLVQNSGTTKALSTVHFTNAQTGWAVGDSGTILKTSNGGGTWQVQTSGTTDGLRSVHFADAQTGWVAGNIFGYILKTTNGGSTWQAQSTSMFYPLSTLYFSDAQTGWIAGMSGAILKTSNGGSNWVSQVSGTNEDITSLYFTDAQTGWAVCDHGTILKTINGGSTWQVQNSGTSNELYSIHFIDSQTGWVVGWGGTLLKTSNGGSTWQAEHVTYNHFYSVQFTDPLQGWAVGEEGTIVNYRVNNPIDPETPTTHITGKLFEKTGTTCTPSSLAVSSRFVKATPGPYYGISNAAGVYQLHLPLGSTTSNYNLEAIAFGSPAFQANTVCPPGNAYSLSLGSIPDTLYGKDFGYEISQCHHLTVEIASNRRRRCFRNTTTISYLNQGSLAAQNAYILVDFPGWVRGISATAPYTALNDSTWRFELGTVAAGDDGGITIIDSVVCGHPEILNLTQCTKATIYPAPDCPPPGGWSGADLMVCGQCINGMVRMVIQNQGQGNMSDSTDFTVLMDSLLVRSGKVKLVAGDSLVLVVNPGGMNVTLSVVQVLNHPSEMFVSTTVEECGSLTPSLLHSTANHFPKNQTPGSKTHCLPIRASYDPNDKQAYPIGFTSNHVVRPGTQMEYLVRFQNTGNDTAFTVYVIDSLDSNLNPETLELVAASHPYEISMQTTRQGRTFLRWQFDQINLPDSNTNELKSHGFFQYRISPKTGISLGSQVRNDAAIYFDFNPPVLTNRTLTTFDNLVFTNPGLSDSVHVVVPTPTRQSLRQLGLDVYPNPFNHTLHLKSASENLISVSICDLMGKELKTIHFRSSTELQLTELPPGVYYLKFLELHRVMKVVKQ